MIATGRSQRIAALYERHAATLERMVSARARVPRAALEDACQTAWARLCARSDIDVEASGVLRWLVVTAVHEAWRYTTRQRELTVGGWLPDAETTGELPEPCGKAPDPQAAAADRDELRGRLLVLTPRERQFLALQAAGLSYAEIATRLRVTVRTVERQILRGRRKLRPDGDGVDA